MSPGDFLASVPEYDPDRDALIGYGLAAVGMLPIFGSAIADISGGMLAQRQQARQHEFNVGVAEAVEDLARRIEGLSPESLLSSDEFVAAYAKASRAAAETTSRDKRARLARVLAHMGPWSGLDEIARGQFLDMVDRYSEVHVLLLRFFRNPSDWLSANATDWRPGLFMTVSIATILDRFVFPGVPNWQSTVGPILTDFSTDGLAQVPLSTSMSESGALEKRTFARGDQFLSFVGG